MPRHLTKPVFTSINFPVLGIAVLRQGSDLPSDKEMMMTFDYGPFLGHGQPDKMGITLVAQGRILAPDYGTTGYGSKLDHFLRSTPAHNTLVVDGQDQPRTHESHLLAFKHTSIFQLAAAQTNKIVPGSDWTRTVMLADSYAIVWDHIEGSKKHQYDWFFHGEAPSLSLSDHAGAVAARPPEARAFAYPFISDVSRQRPAGEAALARWKGAMDLWFMHHDRQ